MRGEGFCRILQKWKILQNSILIRVDESHQPKKGTLIVTNCVSPKISFLNETTSYNTNHWIATASLKLVSDPFVVSQSIEDWSNDKNFVAMQWLIGYGLLLKRCDTDVFEHTLPWYWAPFCIWQCYHPYPPNVLEKMTGGVTMIDMQNVNCYANINWMHELEPNKGPLREDDDDIIIPSIWSINRNSYSISFHEFIAQKKT